MSMLGGNSGRVVRPNSSWNAPKGVFVAIFVLAGGLTYWQGTRKEQQNQVPREYTSTATVHLRRAPAVAGMSLAPALGPPSDPQKVEQQIAASVGDRARQSLRIQMDNAGVPGESAIAITYTDTDATDAANMVNNLARSYAEVRRAEWKSKTDETYQTARTALDRTENDYQQAHFRLEQFYDQQARKPRAETVQAPASRPVQAPPLESDNPRWLELKKQLSEFQRRYDQLVRNRTQLHPAVLEVQQRIQETQHHLASVPQWMAGRPPAPPPIQVAPTAKTEQDKSAAILASLKEDVERTRRASEEAARAERQAWLGRVQEPRIDIELAPPEPLLPASPAQPALALIFAAIATGLTTVTGVGMVLAGAAIEPPLTSAAQVRSQLGVPVVGSIPRSNPRNAPRCILHGCPCCVDC